MPNPSKAKGDRFERSIVQMLQEVGVKAQRVPLSGAAGGEFSGDISLTLPNHIHLQAECKSRKGGSGFKVLEGWLKGNDLLFLHRDRQQSMVVMTEQSFLVLVQGIFHELDSHPIGRLQDSLSGSMGREAV